MQTTIEANTFWEKRASSITITTDENKTRNASEQANEFAWFLTTEKQTLKRNLFAEFIIEFESTWAIILKQLFAEGEGKIDE